MCVLFVNLDTYIYAIINLPNFRMDLSSSFASLLREPAGSSETPVSFDLSGDYMVLHLRSLTHCEL